MATSRLCSIPGCDKRHYGRGWCSVHYQRWFKFGDALAPVGRMTPDGEPERYFNEVVMAYDGDGCLAWPYGKDAYGYGAITLNDRKQPVHRAVCERVNGPPPTPKHDAAHSCGKGHESCCTKRHLSWKTRRENVADTLIHGTRNRGTRQGSSKLTDDKVREIRSLIGSVSKREIGRRFGIAHQTVCEIDSEEIWGWLAQ